MTKYKKIAYSCTGLEDEEIAQRVAFSHGYKWSLSGQEIQKIYGIVMVFDPNTKTINLLLPKGTVVPTEYVVAYGMNTFNDALKAPLADAVTISSKTGQWSATVFPDAITFRSTTSRIVGTVTVPKEFIRKALGNEKKGLPLVSFHYPDSTYPGASLLRYVRVTRYDDQYLQGFELSRGSDHWSENYAEGVMNFKKYDPRKITTLRLEGFVQEQCQ